MRPHSKKGRIWTELEAMLRKWNGPIQKQEILDRMVEVGLTDAYTRESVGNLLSEFKKAGLVDSEGHGYWYLVRKSPQEDDE